LDNKSITLPDLRHGDPATAGPGGRIGSTDATRPAKRQDKAQLTLIRLTIRHEGLLITEAGEGAMPTETTLLRLLVTGRHWQKFATFEAQFRRAAVELAAQQDETPADRLPDAAILRYRPSRRGVYGLRTGGESQP
jgi:hypothetical protein